MSAADVKTPTNDAGTAGKPNASGVDPVYGVRPKSTWQLKNRKTWNLWEFVAARDLAPEVAYQKRPADAPPRGPPPVQSLIGENFFIIKTALIPVIIHAAWNYFLPNHKMLAAPALIMYHLGFINFATSLIDRLHGYMVTYGVFDEYNRGRDMCDDIHVNHLGRSIYIYTLFRSIGPFALAWRGDMTNPFEGLSLYTPLKIAVFEVALDYWFYLYHRSTHEFDFLWWIHRQHHATKHPTPILSILADDVQECIEIFCVPFLASLVAPRLTFIETWLGICYLLYVEAMGHSGVRAYWSHPLLSIVLRPLGMELAVEDHDLHHRFGKSGKNYGKQTRIFDRLFGTIGERIECEQK